MASCRTNMLAKSKLEQTFRTNVQTDAMVRPAVVIKKSQGWDI